MCNDNCTECFGCRSEKLKNKNDKKILFADNVTFDNAAKTVVSVRDGVLFYSGIELNIEPFDKTFKVYRSEKTISELAPKLIGLPITDEHIDMDDRPYNVIGELISSEVVPYENKEELATIAVKNKASLRDQALLDVKRDVSLGFFADLEPAEDDKPYDFMQVNIEPHHLGLVEEGRCGDACKFKDGVTMKRKFHDEGGELNLEELSLIIADLPNFISKLDVDEAKDLAIALKEMRDRVFSEREEIKEEVVETEDEFEKTEEFTKKEEIEDSDLPEDELMDEDMEEEEKEVLKVKYSDSKKFLKTFRGYVDSKVKSGVKHYAEVVNKARNYLDDSYDFSKKTATQIMRDAVKTHHNEEFKDSELNIAFKMLKKNNRYQDFGSKLPENDAVFASQKDKEI